jgi:hypothetical protein
VLIFTGALLLALAPAPQDTLTTPAPPLVILSDTGEERDGLPVVIPHPAPEPYLRVLTRGYSGRLLRLYAMAQRFAHPGRAPQPAYLVLSSHQGGFPRFGFYFNGAQPGTAYVDLHRDGGVTGRPGAMDKIFPHELLHIIMFDLAGPAPEGHASQVHAIGVRTDLVTAFNEGFAEHGQIMAVDDPDALLETRALAVDLAARARAYERMTEYRRALVSRWSVATRARMTFPLWFSNAEQVLRYHAVRENQFARDADVPDDLFARPYSLYLAENVLPGEPHRAAKSVGRLLASEGVVSHLFYRLVTDPTVQAAAAPEATYARFGVDRGSLAPVENAYLKVFTAIEAGKYDAAAVLAAYQRLYPQERDSVEILVRQALLGQHPGNHTPIWLLNERFTTGTTLFDQYRRVPRPHTFDLNAASLADLAGVEGVDRALAASILASAPFETLEAVSRVPGMTAAVHQRLRAMKAAMDAPPPPGTSEEGTLSIQAILLPYVWRALAVWAGCALVSAALYRVVRRVRWWRLTLIGLACGLTGLMAGWTIDPGTGLLALAAPIALFGLPGGVIRLWRTRSFHETGVVLGAWTLAATAPALAVAPLLPL